MDRHNSDGSVEEDEPAHHIVCCNLKSSADNVTWDVEVRPDKPLQTIEGFGACFNELGLDFLERPWQ